MQATVDAQVGDGTIRDIDRDTERTGVVYEVDFTREGVHREIDVAEDGTLLRSEPD